MKTNVKIWSLTIIVLMVVGSYGVVGTQINVENDLDTMPLGPLGMNGSNLLAKGVVMGNGNKDESYARATCYSLEDIECKYQEKFTFRIDYKLDCWGLWDWAECKATVNGVTKYIETTTNVEGYWTFDITCYGSLEFDWSIECRLTDIGWEHPDDCSDSLDITLIGNLQCLGKIQDWAVEPGEEITRSFEVKNGGHPSSKLDWKIVDYPSWGSDWRFVPSSGEDLGDGSSKTVSVSFIAPPPRPEQYIDDIEVVNMDDSSDRGTVNVNIVVMTSRSVNSNTLKFLQAFPFLENLQQFYFPFFSR